MADAQQHAEEGELPAGNAVPTGASELASAIAAMKEQSQAFLQLAQTFQAAIVQSAQPAAAKPSLPNFPRYGTGDTASWKLQIENAIKALDIPEQRQLDMVVTALDEPAASLWASHASTLSADQRTLAQLFQFLEHSGQNTRKHEAFSALQDMRLTAGNLEQNTVRFNQLARTVEGCHTEKGLAALYLHKVHQMSSALALQLHQQNQFAQWESVQKLQEATLAIFTAQGRLLAEAATHKGEHSRSQRYEPPRSRKRDCASADSPSSREAVASRKTIVVRGHQRPRSLHVAIAGSASTSRDQIRPMVSPVDGNSETLTSCSPDAEKKWVQAATKGKKPGAAQPAAAQPSLKKQKPVAGANKGAGIKVGDFVLHPTAVKRTEAEAAALQAEGRCFYCVQTGHVGRKCPDRQRLINVSSDASRPPDSKLHTLPKVLVPDRFQEIQTLSGKLFTFDAASVPDSSNINCASHCSTLTSFLESDLAGHHVWIHAPFAQLAEYVHHYKAQKAMHPYNTSACILLPKWAGIRRLCKGMRLIKEYSKSTPLFMGLDKQGTQSPLKGVPWDVQVFYDPPRPQISVARACSSGLSMQSV